MKESMETNKKDAVVKVNPAIHNLDVVYSAAYTFLDKAYILLDGDPKKEIIVTLAPKGKENPEKLALEFQNELLNYSHYKSKVKDLGELRQALLQRALLIFEKREKKEVDIEDLDLADDSDFLEDPEGIAIPWEEKYGKKKKSAKKRSKRKAK